MEAEPRSALGIPEHQIGDVEVILSEPDLDLRALNPEHGEPGLSTSRRTERCSLDALVIDQKQFARGQGRESGPTRNIVGLASGHREQ
jgi:hypothetical protein